MKTLIAIELDDRFADGLSSWPEATSGRLRVVQGRRAGDRRGAAGQGGRRTTCRRCIVANLPYNVGTPLLVKWLKAGNDWRGPMVLMFQKEVAQRICAAPGDDHYGRLAVLAQAATKPRIAMTIPPGAFRPPPKVDSAVVVLTPLSRRRSLRRSRRAGDHHRRRLRPAPQDAARALKSLEGGVEALEAAGIDGDAASRDADTDGVQVARERVETVVGCISEAQCTVSDQHAPLVLVARTGAVHCASLMHPTNCHELRT